MLVGKALRSSLASFLSFTVSAGPLGTADLSALKVPGDTANSDKPGFVGKKVKNDPVTPDISARDVNLDSGPNTYAEGGDFQSKYHWLASLNTFAELRSPDYPSNAPLSELTPPPLLPIFSISPPPNEELTSQPSSPPIETNRNARIGLENFVKNGLIDPETAQTIIGDLEKCKVAPAKIDEMTSAIGKFYRGEVGKTLSKLEIQAAVWLGYVAGDAGSGKEPLVRGPEGVIGYLRGMDEGINRNEIIIDPRGREGFREYYLSKGVPAVLRLIEEGLVDSVPRSVQLTLSLPSQPWTERIRKLIETDPGECVTAVILTLAANNIPNPFATSLEEGNNPAGLAAQLPKFGYKSLNPPGSEGRLVKMATKYGEVEVAMLTPQEFVKAAYLGNIPTYSVVFQTSHESWVKPSEGSKAASPATSPKSTGFDAAMVIPSVDEHKPFDLWNGRRNGLLIYGGATQSVFVLTPHHHGLKDGDPIQELLLAARERKRQGNAGAV